MKRFVQELQGLEFASQPLRAALRDGCAGHELVTQIPPQDLDARKMVKASMLFAANEDLADVRRVKRPSA